MDDMIRLQETLITRVSDLHCLGMMAPVIMEEVFQAASAE